MTFHKNKLMIYEILNDVILNLKQISSEIKDDKVLTNWRVSLFDHYTINPNYPEVFSKQFIPGGGVIIIPLEIDNFNGF